MGSVVSGGHSVHTPFASREAVNCLEFVIPDVEAPMGIAFVLKQGKDGRWIKHRGGNFYLPVNTPVREVTDLQDPELLHLADRIIQAETGSGSWTLMHRYNLCFDLIGDARGKPEGLALLFVWLRFSAIRQLTWQRNYNTKPRELAHAQDRLSGRLAETYGHAGPGRPFLKLMLATIGRGGDGQRIRDEILQIMHRHHLKEVSGHFLEEWHQKLHNNTTPDDIVICEAYLEFLRSNGNLQRFHETLQNGGVSRQRLETFERPIRTNPEFVAHLKDALIHDFENFLKILKAVHSGTDLETAINAARDCLDAETQGNLWEIWNHRNDPPDRLLSLIGRITNTRQRISQLLSQNQQVRPLLYLDLALEQLIRVAVERNLHQQLEGEQLIGLIGKLLENVILSHEDAELLACLRHWERLLNTSSEPRLSFEWSLHAKSVVDRMSRALADWTDGLYQTLQPKAEFLGQAFGAENWTVSLFSEEVVRGSSLGFALSVLLHQVDRIFRKSAGLGDWQIVSRGQGIGKVEVVDTLRAVQGKEFSDATIVITEKVIGDEELPEKIVGVLAPDVTDLVSHVAVRARNAHILFASCFDSVLLEHLKSLRGQFLRVGVTPAGDVVIDKAPVAQSEQEEPSLFSPPRIKARPSFTKYVVTLDEFNPRIVGGKSCSQKRLRGQLPDWVLQPASVALPFGCFEEVMALKKHGAIAQRYAQLAEQINLNVDTETLGALRGLIEALTAPQELMDSLQAAFAKTGLDLAGKWETVWRGIKQVWASKWNERAILSRKRMGLKDEDLFMAVLIQPVVEADYAFVIHTVNPSSEKSDELYAEMVLGLGETLVGNFPGRALSFVWNKRSEQVRFLSFPSKSVGLYGKGFILRSDSNGEDLAGYAGAGLYDSVLSQSVRATKLDYSTEPLLWDEGFRQNMLTKVAEIGVAVERSLGSAQDIEGAVAQGKYFVVQTRPQVGLEQPKPEAS
jgi:alpha-glucan,water dikinase